MVRKATGRKRVGMVKMKNEANLQVTFSKRRSGLFKKASELCTLCDARIALMVFSPSRKVYSFGHPDLNLLLASVPSSRRMLKHKQANLDHTNRGPFIQMLNDRFSEVLANKEKEQETKAMIAQNEREKKSPEKWWRNSPSELDIFQLSCLKNALGILKMDVAAIAYLTYQTKLNYYVGSSSNAAPAMFNGGYVSANWELMFTQNGMMSVPIHMLPAGYNNHSQIQNQEFHPHHGACMTTPIHTLPPGFIDVNHHTSWVLQP